LFYNKLIFIICIVNDLKQINTVVVLKEMYLSIISIKTFNTFIKSSPTTIIVIMKQWRRSKGSLTSNMITIREHAAALGISLKYGRPIITYYKNY